MVSACAYLWSASLLFCRVWDLLSFLNCFVTKQCHLLWLAATSCHLSVLMSKDSISRLQMSLYNHWGQPWGILLEGSSPLKMQLGIRLSSIQCTCLSKCSRVSSVYMVGRPTLTRTWVLGTFSLQLMPRMRQRHCM